MNQMRITLYIRFSKISFCEQLVKVIEYNFCCCIIGRRFWVFWELVSFFSFFYSFYCGFFGSHVYTTCILLGQPPWLPFSMVFLLLYI